MVAPVGALVLALVLIGEAFAPAAVILPFPDTLTVALVVRGTPGVVVRDLCIVRTAITLRRGRQPPRRALGERRRRGDQDGCCSERCEETSQHGSIPLAPDGARTTPGRTRAKFEQKRDPRLEASRPEDTGCHL